MRLLLLNIFCFLSLAASAQCNLIISDNAVCGGEQITAHISSTSSDFVYRIAVNSSQFSKTYAGDSVIIAPPGVGFEYKLRIKAQRRGVIGGYMDCGPIKEVTVRATPNGNLNFLSGDVNANGVITKCDGDAMNPDFLLEIENVSTTEITNTQYTIDWGDGSAVETYASFNTANHTYGLGFFTMTYTVDGPGNASCKPAIYKYDVFNGSSPTVGIEDPNNFIGSQNLCPPVVAAFDIVNTEDNVQGTVYEFYVGGELVEVFNHPPPASVSYEFIETSCGKTASNGVPNTYDVTIQAYSPCPAPPDFATLGPIIIGDTVKPEFTYQPDPICLDEVVTFENTTQGRLDAIACEPIEDAVWTIMPATGWTLISGDMSGDDEIKVRFTVAGEYQVTLEATNVCETEEITKTIKVHELPVADAVAVLNNPTGCAPAVATFTNLSTQDSSVTYLWQVTPSYGVDFINGTSASSFEPEIEFNRGGNFNVELTVSNACGNPKWDTSFVINAASEFELPTLGNVCADTFEYDSEVTFTDDPDSVVWTFTGGLPATFTGENPPTIIFAGSGNYSISATSYNVCGATTYTENFIVSEPVVIDAGDDFSTCFNQSPTVLSGTPSGGVWSGEGIVGNQFDPSQTTDDSITLTYTFDNGICFFTDSLTAVVIGVNSLSAGDEQTTCVNANELILTGGSPTGGIWIGDAVADAAGVFNPALAQIGDNQVGYVYTEPTLGCQDTVYKNIEVLDIQDINFNFDDSVCVNDSIVYELYVDAGATVTWSFGNDVEIEGNPIEYAFTDGGTQQVKATVEFNGCSVVDSSTIEVIIPPVTDFTLDNAMGCNAFDVNFTNYSTGFIESQVWVFGNGQTGTSASPQNINYQPGIFFDTTYYVVLTSYNACGEDSKIDSVMVSKAPEARFGTDLNAYCQNDNVVINNVSFNSPTSFYWDFGNGETSTVENPKPLEYELSDNDTTYTIMLVATNVCGSDTAQKDVIIKTVDVKSFFNTSDVQGCAPFEVEVINFSSVGASPVWDFGDGNVSIDDTVQNIYTEAGIYTIELAVDNNCSKDTSEIQIEVLPSPNVAFDVADIVCSERNIAFQNQTINGVNYDWDFGDGTQSTLTNPAHSFAAAGNYDVTLTAVGTNLCQNNITQSVEVLETPTSDFDADDNVICEQGSVQFNNFSNAENFEWNFGDGRISTEENPTHSYAQLGSYNVALIVNNNQRCFDTLTMPNFIEVIGTPTADFDYSQDEQQILEGIVEFDNLSGGATLYEWNFGDETATSIETNPIHNYSQSGPFSVMLIAENDYGCIDSIVKPIEVAFFGKLFVPNAMSPALGSVNEAAIFKPKGVGLLEYELEIYSSYGEMLFRTTLLEDGQPVEGWDGTFKGKEMPQDNYVWKIRAKFDNGTIWSGADGESQEVNTVGTLVLIR